VLSPQGQHAVIHSYVGATDVVFLTAAVIMLAAFVASILFKEVGMDTDPADDLPRAAEPAVTARL
jgi:hypothetical protein